ncbi:methyltransferase domain-containing protein [Salegentibacter sp. BDJ18]|nr:methyltransferase domain-containing protein [Salegentibacter sp. BDJ18]
MKKKGCTLSAEKFQERVNVIFHDHEAAQYDQMHADMKNSLQEQINLLISDLFDHCSFSEKKLKVIDVGCGTGMSTEFLLNSRIEPYIENVTLLDTSKKMLELAGKKAKNWDVKYSVINAELHQISSKFDLVLICSVLHHIPELKKFLKMISEKLRTGGIFIHLQDPNGDYLNDRLYKERVKELQEQQKLKSLDKDFTAYIPKSIKSRINRLLGRKNYIDLINDQLLEEKVIKKRMSADEIWSVTDIHVETKNNTVDKGISLRFLQENLDDFSLISHRSYGFYGKLKYDLDDELRKMEEMYITERQLNGRNISGIWIKN